jgi:hypothetical protein
MFAFKTFGPTYKSTDSNNFFVDSLTHEASTNTDPTWTAIRMVLKTQGN